jgi:endonuclease-3
VTPSRGAPAAGKAAATGKGKTAGKAAATGRTTAAGKAGTARRRARPDPDQVARRWAAQLEKKRPGLLSFVLDRLAEVAGRPAWQRRLDPTSELVLTILSQNSADTNAEAAFAALRDAYPSEPVPPGASAGPRHFAGWGGQGLPDLPPPDWAAVEAAPIAELVNVIRPGGLANQKAPRIQAALRALVANGGGYSLEFLATKPALEARDWLAAIPGIGKKTASVVLLFSFGLPLMPVDRHVHRVSQRIGLIPPKAEADAAHDYYLAMLRPDQMFETHVSLISHGRRTCHAQRPDCEHCPVALRCRYFVPDAP